MIDGYASALSEVLESDSTSDTSDPPRDNADFG